MISWNVRAEIDLSQATHKIGVFKSMFYGLWGEITNLCHNWG